MKKIFGFIIGVCIVLGIVIGNVFFDNKNNNQEITLAAVIEENFTELAKLEVDVVTSSNPYSYIDNEYYDNIVSLGVEAIDILEDKSRSGEFDGLNSYISALAIQDITGCNLYEITGEDWENANEFFGLWDETIGELPDIFSQIIKDENISSEQKVKKIEKYGIFGEVFLSEVSQNTSKNITYFNIELNGDILEEEKQYINESVNLVKEEKEFINKYIKEKR